MEKTDHAVSEGGVSDVKNQSSLHRDEKSSVHSLGTHLSSLTPVKKDEQLHITKKIDITELPERYRNLSEFFRRMLSSLRLLDLRKRSPTFHNVSRQVEVLTRRKFSHEHLAQIKYIFPEAVQIDKLLVHDSKTMCMKPDIKITLHFNIIEDHQEHSMFIALSNLFDSRLMDFLHKNGPDCEIPKAVLPDPFNQLCLTSNTKPLRLDLSSPLESESLSSSHVQLSFSPHFSRQAVVADAKSDHLTVSVSTCSPCETDCTLSRELDSKRRSPKLSQSSNNLKYVEESQSIPGSSSVGNEKTPMKLISESELLLETPAQPTPQRSVPITEDKHKKVTDIDSVVSNVTVKRSLDFFSLGDEEEMPSDLSSVPIEHHEVVRKADICPQEALEMNCSSSKGVKNFQNLTASHQESDGLSNLVRLIHRIFQSVGCRSMTKEELVHKIIVNDLDIDEKADVEKQIEFLEELVPDWLCKNSVPTGDLLYSIKKVDLNSVCERVLGA